MQYVPLKTENDFCNSIIESNHALLFSESTENGIVIKAKNSDGTFTNIVDPRANGLKAGFETLTGESLASIAAGITSLNNSKTAIRNAIAAKGQTCTSSTPLSDYANLISNISGGGRIYKCAMVNTGTWTGYLYDSTSGWFATSETTGLTYTTVTPVVGKIYTEDALIRIADIGFLDSFTQFLLYGNLTDASSNAIAVTNNGLTSDGTKISLLQNCYASIAANALPSTVFCDNQNWSFEIKFRCTETSAMPSGDFVCLFGNGCGAERFDMLVNSSLIRIGGFNDCDAEWTPDTAWHIYKVNHSSANVFSFVLDGTSSGTTTKSSFRMREFTLCIGNDADTSSRYGYPFEIAYILDSHKRITI